MALWIQPAISAYGADQALPFIDMIQYDTITVVSLGMALWTQPAISSYGADQALPLIDTIRYEMIRSLSTGSCIAHCCRQHCT